MVIQGSFLKLFIVLTALIAFKCSNCKIQETETAKDVFLSCNNIGILLCQKKCTEHGPCRSIEYNSDTLTCHRLNVDSKDADGFIVRPKPESDAQVCLQMLDGHCTSKSCEQDKKCLKTRPGREACVKEPGGMYQRCAGDINGSVCYFGRCMCTTRRSKHVSGSATWMGRRCQYTNIWK